MPHDSDWRAARDLCRRVALGLEPPSLLIRDALVFSVFTGEFLFSDVPLCGELIAGIGSYPAGDSAAVLEAGGRVLLPGFIDAHVHVESSLVSPRRFAEAIVPHGVTTVLAEPHELANILGPEALEFFLAAREGLPLDLLLMLPSSIPASEFETGAARMLPEDVERLLAREGVVGLGEVMDYPAVLSGGPVWRILERAVSVPRDGHAPDLQGRELAAYMTGGMTTDHETSRPELLLERRRLGLWLLAREGSAARDLDRVVPFLREHGAERTALCTDDRHAATLAEEHHLDGMVGRLVAAGIPLAAALRTATLAPAEIFGLRDRGAVAPGFRADLLLVEDVREPHPSLVIQRGRVVAREGELVVGLPTNPTLRSHPPAVWAQEKDLLVPLLPMDWHAARAIGAREGSLATEELRARVRLHRGRLESDPPGLVYIALLERHRGTGEVGAGLVGGLGLHAGALASTVAHDSHQLIVAGTDARDMLRAVQALVDSGGGLAVAGSEGVLTLPLPLAGLMTDRPVREVGPELRTLEAYAGRLGCTLSSPFMALSFLSLSVIPRLRITLGGLLDVDAGRLVSTLVE